MKKDPSIIAAEKEIQAALSRRKFLQGLAGAGGLGALRTIAGGTALEMITRGVMDQALAADRVESKTFIDIYLRGGFPAQYLYLVLNPYAGQTPMANRWEGNNWVGGQMTHTTASLTANGQTINMPYLWGKTIPKASARGGGIVSMNGLFANSMFSEGYDFKVNSHDFTRLWSYRPDASGLSLHGAAGDASDPARTPLPVVFGDGDQLAQANFSSTRSSMKNVNQVAGANNAIVQLLGPVQADASMRTMMSRRDTFSSLFQTAVDSIIRDTGLTRGAGADAITSTVTGAESLVRRNFGDLAAEFDSLRLKYADLIQRSTNMSEVFTTAISPDLLVGGAPNPVRSFGGGVFANNADLRSMINSTTTPRRLAEGFAMAEFLVRENLSKAINIAVDGIDGIQIDGMSAQHSSFDQHETGSAVALVINTFAARAIAACVFELQTRLQELGKFDSSFIKLGSEFTRAPKNNETGSDHGYGAQCFWGLSGSIHRPFVVGNLQLNSARAFGSTYVGTWGRYATVTHEGSSRTILTVGHYASTICAALGIPSPVPNFQGVVETTSQGEIVPSISLTELKDEV